MPQSIDLRAKASQVRSPALLKAFAEPVQARRDLLVVVAGDGALVRGEGRLDELVRLAHGPIDAVVKRRDRRPLNGRPGLGQLRGALLREQPPQRLDLFARRPDETRVCLALFLIPAGLVCSRIGVERELVGVAFGGGRRVHFAAKVAVIQRSKIYGGGRTWNDDGRPLGRPRPAEMTSRDDGRKLAARADT